MNLASSNVPIRALDHEPNFCNDFVAQMTGQRTVDRTMSFSMDGIVAIFAYFMLGFIISHLITKRALGSQYKTNFINRAVLKQRDNNDEGVAA